MHYIPTDSNFDNISLAVQWARAHDAEVRAIVHNANEFVDQILSAEGIYHYFGRLFAGFHKITHAAPVLLPGSLEFTCKFGTCLFTDPDTTKTYGMWPKPQ